MNIEICNAALKKYCRKYHVDDGIITKSSGDLIPMLDWKGRHIPLFYWRRETKLVAMRSCLYDGTLSDASSGKFFRVSKKDGNIKSEMLHELDIAQWLTGSPIYQVVKASNGAAIDMIAYHENKVITTIEIAMTLSDDTEPVSGHEIDTVEGLTTDKAVDAMIDQKSVYMYTDSKTPESFTDVSFDLYGLDYSETALVKYAYDILSDEQKADVLTDNYKQLSDMIDTILESGDFAKVRVGGTK